MTQCSECGCQAPAHYGSCSKVAKEARDVFEAIGRPQPGPAPRPQMKLVPKTPRERLRAVAKGATINGTYRMSPDSALEAFRADLLLVVGDE